MTEGRRERQCDGKIRHATEREARAAAKRTHKIHKCRFDAYACPFCAGWHVGTRRSRQQQERRAGKRLD